MKTWMGVVLSIPIAILTWVVVGSIPNMLGNYGGWAVLFVLIIGPLSAFAAGGGVIAFFSSKEAAEEERRRHDAQVAAQKAAEERRRLEELRLAALCARQLASDAQDAALSLSTVQAGAEIDLDRAEAELSERCYWPFWEAVEDATSKLNIFDQRIALIEDRRVKHQEQIDRFGNIAPKFALGIAVLPAPEQTHRRLRSLYRQAQKDANFANIYGQRRIAGKIDQTNAILIAGFTSLGQAIEQLGDRTEDAIRKLGANLDCRLGSVQSSLEASAAAAAEQHRALLAELDRSATASDHVVQQLRRDAANRSEHERSARRMLDNIQRHRKPAIWETL